MTDRQTEKREIIKAENADSINRWNRLDKKNRTKRFFSAETQYRKHSENTNLVQSCFNKKENPTRKQVLHVEMFGPNTI